MRSRFWSGGAYSSRAGGRRALECLLVADRVDGGHCAAQRLERAGGRLACLWLASAGSWVDMDRSTHVKLGIIP